jgi:di/tricarboxylate transporter
MTVPQLIALAVLVSVVGALIWGRVRPDVVALAGAAVLLATRTLRPVEVQAAFASPAIIALASLFVIAYAMELSGLLGFVIRMAMRLCARLGSIGLWIVIGVAGATSAFMNNTPIVVLAAPIVKEVAESLGRSPKRYLLPLSYVTILGGACTLIGTSTNLLVNDMARTAGQPGFSLFEMAPVGLAIAAVGVLYLMLVSGRLLKDGRPARVHEEGETPAGEVNAPGDDPSLFPVNRPLNLFGATASMTVFLAVVIIAAVGLAPIAATAFSGAVLLVVLRVISPEEAYRGLRPDILFLIAGMVVVGLALEITGLASVATDGLARWVEVLGPLAALAILYGATLFLTEVLSNAAVAVLITPVAVALAEHLGVNPRPFIVAVMMAASAAFATPFGYQTNVLVYRLGGYAYADFVRVGLPLNLITWVVAVLTIPLVFPF